MRIQPAELIALFMVALPMAAIAGVEGDLIGDKDGFDIGVNADESFNPGKMPGYDGLGDGDGTDKWDFGSPLGTVTCPLTVMVLVKGSVAALFASLRRPARATHCVSR